MRTILEVLTIFVLPIILFQLGLVPVKYRFAILIICSLIILGVVIKERWTLHRLGIRTDNLRQGLIPYVLFTILGVIAIVTYAKSLGLGPMDTQWWTNPHFTYLFLPISLLQEFAYRSYLMPRLKSIFASAVLVILVNAILFTILHTIYPSPHIMIPLAFVGGLGFALIYYYYPNLILISLSHSVLNFAAVYFGFFSYPRGA